MKAKGIDSKILGISLAILISFINWGVASADYHNGFDCIDCHDMHGDTSNSKLIAEYVPWDPACDPGNPIFPPCTNPVTFVGGEDPWDYIYGSPDYEGICEVCHTATKYYRNDGSGVAHPAYQHDQCPDNDCHLPDGDCMVCHSHYNAFSHAGGGACGDCHGTDGGVGTVQSHSTHTEGDADDVKGPNIACDNCHDTNNYPYFQSGTGTAPYDLSETDVCDTCHSPDGAFDGVNDGIVGAKINWADGIYEADSTTLKSDKKHWCATCHDDVPAIGGGTPAPNVIGDNTDYGFYVTGHKINCLNCHDASKSHIDGEHRTYYADSSPNNYQDGYRLGSSMTVSMPEQNSRGPSISGFADLCFDCHNPNEVLGTVQSDITHTNFYKVNLYFDRNLHNYHFGVGGSTNSDSDFDGTLDSAATCTICHSVHGAKNSAMIRSGELMSTPGTTDKVPALDFTYLTAGSDDPYAALANTEGGNMQYLGGFSANHLCNDCHSSEIYIRTPNLNPKVLDRKATPGSVPQGEVTQVLLTARVVDPDGNIDTVTIDLSAIGGLSEQTMYDNGTNGDVSAGDDVFSFEATVPDMDSGLYYFMVTGTDFDGLTSEGEIVLKVISPGEIIIDNAEAEATFVGSWYTCSGTTQKYGSDFRYKAAGTGSATATWTPVIPVAGTYNVYAWWVDNDPAHRASNAPYTIYYSGGDETVRMDQSTDGPGGGQWNLLGTYTFAAGTAGYVQLSDDANNLVVADAIKWEAVGETYQISGQITEGGPGVDGITVQLTGDMTDSTVTAGGGNYSFTVSDGNYTVTPSSTSYEFVPTHIDVMVSGSDQLNQDFTATVLTTYEISGEITASGTGVDGVTVSLTGDHSDSTVTSGGGIYSFTVSDGSYTVTPSLTNCEFSPAYRDVTISGADETNQDFTATVNDIIIDNSEAEATFVGSWNTYSGTVQEYGSDFRYKAAGTGSATATWTPVIPVAGTYNVYAWWVDNDPVHRASNAPYTIYYSGGDETVRMDQSTDGPGGGHWNLLGTYTFAAGTAGYVQLSDDADNVVVADAIKWEAVGETYQISGQITEGGPGVDGITVQLTGDMTDSTVSAGGGNYSFTVPDGSYTVTPSSGGYEFAPTHRNVTVSGADETNQDFTATALTTYEISGEITENGTGVDGVTVSLSGDLSDSTVTSGGGIYSFTVPDGSYTVTPSSGGYEFDPTHRDVTVSGADETNQDFTATVNDIIIDNSEAEASFVGSWSTYSGTAQEYGSDFRYKAAGSGSATATWTPVIPVAGTYNVYAWWVDNDPACRASNAPYTIYYSGGDETVRMDQSTDGHGGGHWNLLGTYTFAAGTAGYVQLSDYADNIVIADAIKWEAVGETYQISGQITDGPGGGITVQLTGDMTNSTVTTGAGDNYSFTVPPGNYRVTPCSTSYEFAPTYRDVMVSGSDQLNQDFTATALTTYEISGEITENGGTGVDGVTVSLSGDLSDSTVTAGGGNYSFTVPDGIYTVTPSLTNCEFSPTYRDVTVSGADETNQDFTATVNDIIIDNSEADATFVGSWNTYSGSTQEYGSNFRYKAAGSGSATATWTPVIPVAGTYNVYAWWVDNDPAHRASNAPYTIYYSGGDETKTVDQSTDGPGGGHWNLLGTYTFAAGTAGYVQLSDYADNIVIADAIKWEAVGETYQISGQITDGPGGGITVQLTGDMTDSTVTTGAGDNYSFTVPPGNYRVTPCSTSYEFDPTHRDVTVSGADETNQDFTATALTTYEISGEITENGTGVDGVTVSLSGDLSDSTVTSGGGIYSFTVPDGSYTVTPSLTNCEFSPAYRDVTVSGSDQLNQDFTATVNDIIIDNSEAEATFVGSWNTYSGSTQEYGSDFRYKAAGSGSATATWTPVIPVAGTYNVYAWWVDNDPACRASNAPYTIYYSGVDETVRMDQSTDGPGGGQWNLLGTYTFAAGTAGYVQLSDDADNFVVADAIKWELQP